VVLIDEVDKAQRDFPNDILNEVEGMYFRIPELENAKVQADSALAPILVLTSNSEKHLPDAFLRRCIYYHIPFPDSERLKTIIQNHLGEFVSSTPFLEMALNFFEQLRDCGLQKKPATAELLNWLVTLKTMFPDQENPLAQDRSVIERTLSVLIKSKVDRDTAQAVVKNWLG
jgi:MoxR-like ATPase